MVITNMAWPYIDIAKNVGLQGIIAKATAQKFAEGKAEGRVEMLRGLLHTRFGPLPK